MRVDIDEPVLKHRSFTVIDAVNILIEEGLFTNVNPIYTQTF